MERVLTDYEKMKKAEEIYNRRKMMGVGGVRLSSPSENCKSRMSRTNEYNVTKKMVIQIIACIILYFVVYVVQNSNYIFSAQFISKTKESG